MVEATAPIALFDSGVGGLTVARAVKTDLPNERLVYFGDTARVPYGPKSADTVRRYSREITLYLQQFHPKLLVVACNTSTAHALETVSEAFGGPVVGVVEPGARAAVAATCTGRVGVLGTRGTIASGAYQAALLALDPRLEIFPCACGLFVPIVEEGLASHPVAREMAEHYLRPLLASGVDTLILGCTHYPLLENILAEVAGPQVTLVSSAEETSRQVYRVLTAQAALAPSGNADGVADLFMASDDAVAFQVFQRLLFGDRPACVEQVELEAPAPALPGPFPIL